MRRLLILIHRYLGIALSLLFAVWFISGIAMIYAKGMPHVTSQLRLERLAALQADSVRITSAAAVQTASPDRPPARVVLSSVGGRPVFSCRKHDGVCGRRSTHERGGCNS